MGPQGGFRSVPVYSKEFSGVFQGVPMAFHEIPMAFQGVPESFGGFQERPRGYIT